jgi:2-polyprenyl-3-methyl-5-hydroxy-6-metoxy-1,4-benzoquinol methylase
MSPDEIYTTVKEIRDRARDRYQKKVSAVADFELPSLDGLGNARDAAEGHVASIGRVNPRPPGLVNNIAQGLKKLVGRALDWHIRDQVDFNRAVVRFMDTVIEVEAEQNSNLVRVARSVASLKETHEERYHELKGLIEHMSEQQDDMLRHWNQWRPAWEERLTASEISLLHSIREMEAGAREREASFQTLVEYKHKQYLDALAKATDEIQDRSWNDIEKLKSQQEDLIHTELRLIRRRAAGGSAPSASAPVAPASAGGNEQAPAANSFPPLENFDYARFEERFRGREDYVARSQQFYLSRFRDCRRVLDLGCGRGEFLELLSKEGIEAQGVDLDADAVAACREKGLAVSQADLFQFLAEQPNGSLNGILCSHVVEHLAPARIAALVTTAAEKLAPGGLLAIETPNPACLATLAGDFFLDPTHVRPVPFNLLHFLYEEAGLGDIEIEELRMASEVIPEVMALDHVEGGEAFRKKFLGGLDYAILGRLRAS